METPASRVEKLRNQASERIASRLPRLSFFFRPVFAADPSEPLINRQQGNQSNGLQRTMLYTKLPDSGRRFTGLIKTDA